MYIRESYESLGYRIIDTWWQTELGCVTIASTNDEKNMGKPLSFSDIALLNNENEIIPFEKANNSIGELLINMETHPSIMNGYYKNPQINETKFISNYYRTGDIVEIIEDGTIEYISRADDVIVNAGELITPDEVESFVVSTFKTIHDAAFVKSSNDDLILFCEGKEDKNLIKEHILNNLANAMVPHEIIFLEKIPRTESGKVKRNHLKGESYEKIQVNR